MGEVRRAVESARSAPPTGSAFQGPLPDPEVVRVIRSNLPAVKGCYAIEEKAGTVGSGKAIVSIEIDPGGSVSQVRIDAPAFAASNLPSWHERARQKLDLPQVHAGRKSSATPSSSSAAESLHV